MDDASRKLIVSAIDQHLCVPYLKNNTLKAKK
jgi:hypothetical protein